MKITENKGLILLAGILAAAPGCVHLGTNQPPPAEPELETKSTVVEERVVSPDIEEISRKDTTGRVSAAQEAAETLLKEAKKKSEQIIGRAEKVMAVEKRKAEFEAQKIISAKLAEMKKENKEALKKYVAAKKAEAETNAGKIIAEATKKSESIKKSAEKYADAAKKKADAESKKISLKILENARSAAAEITAAAQKKADKLKKESEKLLKSSKAYAEKQKKSADEYLNRKISEADKKSGGKKKSGKASKKITPALANSYLDKILKGIEDNDYKRFTANFTADLKKVYTEEHFKALNKQLKDTIGKYQSRIYLGDLLKGPFDVYLWKGKFSKAKNNDVVLRLMLSELDGKVQVFRFDISNL